MTTLSDTPGEGLDPLGYATRLLVSLMEKHYPDRHPEWKPLPDLYGVLTQIDNLSTGLVRSPSVSSDTAALPSGYAGLVEAVARRIFNDEHEGLQNCYDWDSHGLEGEHPGTRERYYGYAESAVSEAIAALGRVEPVAVKPLEWRHLPDAFPPMWVTKTTIGSYHIEEAAGSDSPSFDLYNPMAGPMGNFEGLPEAKAAAQSDYERRILSALATPPAPQPALSAQGEAAQPAAEGFVLVPTEPTPAMIEKGLAATGAWLDIPGSKLTVNREKMRRRYCAMVAASPNAASQGGGRE